MEVTMAPSSVLRLFDTVPECMVETLLVVHGSGDRNSAEFTQVCETWTRVLAPWIRTWEKSSVFCRVNDAKTRARWNGKYYRWYIATDMMFEKGVFYNGNATGEWQQWYSDGRLYGKGKYYNDEAGERFEWHAIGGRVLSSNEK